MMRGLLAMLCFSGCMVLFYIPPAGLRYICCHDAHSILLKRPVQTSPDTWFYQHLKQRTSRNRSKNHRNSTPNLHIRSTRVSFHIDVVRRSRLHLPHIDVICWSWLHVSHIYVVARCRLLQAPFTLDNAYLSLDGPKTNRACAGAGPLVRHVDE